MTRKQKRFNKTTPDVAWSLRSQVSNSQQQKGSCRAISKAISA
jgi:hypothetical protein